jgi:ribosomal protein L37AE/L43A
MVSWQAFSRCQFWSVQRVIEMGLLEAESWRCRFPSRQTFQEKRKVFATVDHRGTSKQCPNCGTEWDNNLSIRWHTCTECGYSNNRDVASAEAQSWRCRFPSRQTL